MFAVRSDKKQKYYSKWRVIFALFASLLGGLVCGLCSMYFATSSYSLDMFLSYFYNPYIVLLNLLPPAVLAVVFYLIFNRAAWSYLLTNAVVISLTVVNYYKITFRGDAFIAEDFSLIKESANMISTGYSLFIDTRIAAYLAVLVLGTVLLATLVKGRIKGFWRRIATAILIFALSFSALPLYASDDVYEQKTANNALINEWSDTDKFISRGFVYPFLHSFKYAFDTPPENYSEAEAAQILASYTDSGIPADKAVNIVCVMLEAFNDFSRFEQIEFTEDVYAKYRELENMGYRGTLITDIFAGDTRISEREFLTGMPYGRIDNFVGKVNSYVWYLKENGYTVEGAHPCYAWFYNRQNINKNLGFDNYYFTENYFKERTGGNITWDGRFFPMLRDIYLSRDKSKPYFSFSVTYQGHGPYSDSIANFDHTYINASGVSSADEYIINNYLNAQALTVDYLYTFVNEMLATKEPLVLVFFGDHKPWMGNGGETYGAFGINVDPSTNEGFFNYYSTRYLILANDAAKSVTGNPFRGRGQTMSVSFLMNKVFELCGYSGSEYMQFTSDIMKEGRVIHRSDIGSTDASALYDRVSYYYRKNFVY